MKTKTLAVPQMIFKAIAISVILLGAMLHMI